MSYGGAPYAAIRYAGGVSSGTAAGAANVVVTAYQAAASGVTNVNAAPGAATVTATVYGQTTTVSTPTGVASVTVTGGNVKQGAQPRAIYLVQPRTFSYSVEPMP